MEKKLKKDKPAWLNALGELVPDSAIQPFDKRKEKMLRSVVKKAEAVSKMLLEIKAIMLETGDSLYAERLKLKGFNPDDRKGNYTLFSYSKDLKLELKISDIISFNDDINLAQRRLNEYIEEVTDGTNKDLKLLINNAFKTTAGRLDKARVLSLLSYEITHEKWVQAMDLIRTSISVANTKRYPSLSVRKAEGEYEQINLNFSTL